MITLPYPLNESLTLFNQKETNIGKLPIPPKNVTTDDILKNAIFFEGNVKEIKLGNHSFSKIFNLGLFSLFIDSCPNCEKVDFCYLEQLRDHDFKSIARILSKKDCKIRTIALRSLPRITTETLEHLNKIPNLQIVEMEHNLNFPKKPNVDTKFKILFKEWSGY